MRKLVLLIVLSIALIGTVVSAVDDKAGEVKETAKQGEKKIVAMINGTPIYFSEVEKRIDNFEKKFQEVNPAMKLPEEKRIKMRQDFLDRMVREKILELAAEKEKYTVSDAEIDDRINQLQKIFGDGEQAKQRFLGGISDMDDFRKNISKQIKIDKYIETQQKLTEIKVSDSEVRDYYDKNLDKFNQDEAIRISQITWRLPPEEDPEYAEKLKLAQVGASKAMQEAQSGVDFAELAKKYSQDKKTVEKGGDIGFIKRKQMVEPLENAAFALAVGEVSKPIKTQFGVYLLKATEKKDAKLMSFDEVKETVKTGLMRKKQGKSREQIYQDLRNKSKIEILL
ncbi:peptidylprolyl isomerase [bacterium]|nr:peptidylprolyl isomerase [bacterium]